MEKHRWQEWLLGYRHTGAIQVIYVVYLYGEYGLTKSWRRGNSPWTLAVHQYHAALWQALYVIMHPALILAGTINLDKSSHDFFHSHCHSPTPMIIMAQPLTSSKVASSSTSIHCVENYPVHPKEVHPHPSISTLRSTTPLLPTSHSYP